jgi:hypothetical protein
MPSTAISAQGTKFGIAGTPGTALTITSITKAVGAVCSCASPPPVGSVVVFASATGMPEIVGRIGIVTAIAAGVSFTTNIDSSGFGAAATAASATPQTFIQIANIHDYTGFDGSASEIDVTNLQSLAKEYNPGLEDFGQFSMNVDIDNADPGQIAMRAAKTSQVKTYFQLIMRNATIRVFYGFVKKMSEAGAVDGVVKGAVDMRISGRPSMSEVVN